MSKIKNFFYATFLVAVFAEIGLAQSIESRESLKSYETVLQILTSTNDSAKIPTELGNVGKKLKQIYPSLNFVLAETHLGKVVEGNGFSTRRITTLTGQNGIIPNLPSYFEFAAERLKSGQNKIETGRLNIGFRVPLKINEAISYDSINFIANNLILTENIPTVIGTLTAYKPNEIIVLVLTIKSDVP